MDFLYLEEIDSTNKYAKDNLIQIPDKTVVYTYRQTAGRGRFNRTWNYLGEDNIYASIVLKPSNKMEDVYSNLTQFLCVILAQTFEEYGVKPKIKWPNDIKINEKKISGILAEAVNTKNRLEGLIIGFGINLNTKKEDLSKISQPATSLNVETGKFIDKEVFLKKITNRFCLLYNRFIEGGFPFIREEYLRRVDFLNKEVTVKVFDKFYTGIVLDVTKQGALKLLDKNNNEHTLLIGDIL